VSANLPIIFDPRAIEDIDTAVEWYVKQQLEPAVKFIEALDAVIVMISQYPEAYREVDTDFTVSRSLS
jgi:plasmid stabilization system protein ParE